MKPPNSLVGACIALALAACSGAQPGSIANPVPAVGTPQTSSATTAAVPSINKDQHLAGVQKATTGLILVANETSVWAARFWNMPKAPTGTLRRAP